MTGFLGARVIGLIEEALAEVDAAEHVLVGGRHLVKLDVRLGVLNICFHQGGSLLNALDQHLLAADGFFHQCCLLRCELMSLRILWLLLCIRAGHTQADEQEGEG